MRLSILFVILFSVFVKAQPVVLYVSTNGSNSWSGSLAEPNAEMTDGPLATLEAARNKVRDLKWNTWGGVMQSPVEVQVRGGVYYETPTFQLYWYDSGDASNLITYKAYMNETPVFSGGRVLPTLVKAEGDDYYSAIISQGADHNWLFRQLWINDVRYTLAKSPNKGYYYVAGIPDKPAGLDDYWDNYWQCHYFNYNDNDLKIWDGLSDGDITMQVFSLWEVQTVILESVTPASKQGYTESHVLWGLNPHDEISSGGIVKRYFIENAPDAMDAPGEWRMDRNTGLMKVIPFDNEDISAMTAVAPVTQKAVEIIGSPDNDQFVEYVKLEGLAFRHYSSPPLGSGTASGYKSNQGASNHPACIQLDGARYISFNDCEISHNGMHAIQMSRGCTYNTIEKCHIFDVGAGGIYIGERIQTSSGYAPGDYGRTGNNTVHNNYIHHGGQVVASGMGIVISQSDNNTVTNNEISYFSQCGMQIGWNWDTAVSYSHDNNISYNHVHHIGLNESSDLGAIYTVGDNLNTFVSNNLIHDVFCWMEGSGKGLYPDENTNGVTYEKNIIYNVGAYCLGVNYCRDIILRNNIFASPFGKGPFMFGHRANATITNNIFYYHFGNPYCDNYDHISASWFVQCDSNIYWRSGGNPILFQKLSPDGGSVTERIDFDQWQSETGFDDNSYVTDPKFADPENGDFSFEAGSPYSQIGFTPIDASAIGLTGEQSWKELPAQYKSDELNPLYYEEFLSSAMTTRTVTFSVDGLASGFEYNVPGNPPKGGEVSGGEVTVSDENPSAGTYSAKFDSDVSSPAGIIYDMYDPIVYNGTVRFVCDIYRQQSAGVNFTFSDLANNLNISIEPGGDLSAQSQVLASSLPQEQWLNLMLTFNVGRSSDAKCSVKLTGSGAVIYEGGIDLAFEFDKLETVSITAADDGSDFYIDNLVVKRLGGGTFSFDDDLKTDMDDFSVFSRDVDSWQSDVELFEGFFLTNGDLKRLASYWLGYNPQTVAAAWDFTGGSGSTCQSAVLGGGDLTLVGSQGWNAEGFVFDGSNYFTMSKTAPNNNLDFLKDFSVTVVFKTTDTGINTIWSRLNECWEPGCKQFFVKNGKVWFDCGWIGTVEGNMVVNDGQWHTAKVSYSKAFNRIDIFIDGALDVSSVLGNELTSKPDDYDFFVGCQQEFTDGSRHALFHGTIKEIVIEN